MDKQIAGLSSSLGAESSGSEFLNLTNPQRERRDNGVVQKIEEILPSYDFQPIRTSSDVEPVGHSRSSFSNLFGGATRAMSIFESKRLRWMNGVELLDDALRNKRFLPTGCEGIDTLLGGGLREGQLTEIVGPSSSGKTQICLYVASQVAARHCGSIIFFDTSNSFSPTRIVSIVNQICKPVDKEDQERRIKTIMCSIQCQSIFDIFSLQDALHELGSTLKMQTVRKGTKICMLIVDSVSSLITPILGSKDSQGRSLMLSAGYLMKQLADEWNLSVLVTNHMVGGEGGTLKPALGESWKCIPHVRLELSRYPGSSICNVSVLKHTSMACGRSAEFVIPN